MKLNYLLKIIFIIQFFIYINGTKCYDERQSQYICQKGFDIVKDHLSPSRNNTDFGLNKLVNLGCASLCQNKLSIIRYLGKYNYNYLYYRLAQRKFLDEVSWSSELTAHSIVMFYNEDNGHLHLNIKKLLTDEGIIFLSHSARLPVSPFEILQPDFHYIETIAWLELRRDLKLEVRAVPISEKFPKVYWRGGMGGNVHPSLIGGLKQGHKEFEFLKLPRVKLAIASKHNNYSWLDCKVIYAFDDITTNHLKEDGLLSERVSEDVWIENRGIIDIDGNVNAWGMYWRLWSGSVIFKVDSPYVNAYVKEMIPWVHYIPVSWDLSNLMEITNLVVNPNERTMNLLQKISDNAKILAEKFSYQNEIKRLATEIVDFTSRNPIILPEEYQIDEIPTESNFFSGDIIRCQSCNMDDMSNQLHLIRMGKRYEFKTPDLVIVMGYNREIIHDISEEVMKSIPFGGIIDFDIGIEARRKK
jgi:hypothetical protein